MTSLPPAYVHPGPPPEPPEYPEGLPPLKVGAATWKPWTGFLVIVLAFSVPLVLGLLAGIGIALAGGDLEDDLPSGVLIALTFAQDIGFILAPLLVATWFAARPRSEDFGLAPPRRAWLAVGLLIAVYVGYVVISGIYIQAFGFEAEDQLPDELGVNNSNVNLVLVLVLITVMAPVAEEMLFRGYIYRALRNGLGVAGAAILSGMIFGGIHLGSSPTEFIPPLMLLGVGLGLLYQWTGSLYAPVALHAFNNAIAFGVLIEWTWQIPLLIAGSIVVSLLALRLLSDALGSRRSAALGVTSAA